MIVFCCMILLAAGVTSSSQTVDDLSSQYVFSATTPNITLTNDNVLLCVAFNMTNPSLESDFIVAIEPKPAPGMKEYFFFDSLCDEPGYIAPNGELVPWDCGAAHKHPLNPPLPHGEFCSSKTPFLSIPHHFQYQGQPLEVSRLRLPEGTGIPIGGRDDPKFLVLGMHFPLRANALYGATGVTTLDYTITRHGPEMQVAHSLDIHGYGHIDPWSHANVSASWTLDKDQDLKFISLYVHVHHMAIKYEVKIERSDGQTDVIMDEDPMKFLGMRYPPDSPSVHLGKGDRVVITCVYYNRMDQVLEVGSKDKCYLLAHYVVTGEPRRG